MVLILRSICLRYPVSLLFQFVILLRENLVVSAGLVDATQYSSLFPSVLLTFLRFGILMNESKLS